MKRASEFDDNSDIQTQRIKHEDKQSESIVLMRSSPALTLKVLKNFKKARASTIILPHGDVCAPVYMPVGTKGAIKGLTYKEMEDLDCRILLGNTYHLAYQPGGDFLEKVGGLHNFVNWKYNLLTDSGGFQMVSLSKLCEVSEDCVTFESPVDGSKMSLRPEDSIHVQNQIGGDIIMALDDVVRPTTEENRTEEACDRTLRWIDRCITAHKRPESQNLFGIIQGGLDLELRRKCIKGMIEKDLPGYAIGGLAGGESKEDFWKVVNLCTDLLPNDKPRYLMGVGYPDDLVVCSCLGVDMFDCVFSTRTARFGVAFTKYGFIKLTKAENATIFAPIEEDCGCSTCKTYTRSFLNSIITREEVGAHLLTTHNLYYLLNLMKNLRQAILDGVLEDFVCKFFTNQYQKKKEVPKWIVDALEAAGIALKPEF